MGYRLMIVYLKCQADLNVSPRKNSDKEFFLSVVLMWKGTASTENYRHPQNAGEGTQILIRYT